MPNFCDCERTLPLFCASLIQQPWMRSTKHCPAVRCPCGKTYWSMSERKRFVCRKANDEDEVTKC